MGAYHGRYGFDEFSHRRAIYRHSTAAIPLIGTPLPPSMPTPPYTDKKYELAIKLQLQGLLTDGQKAALKLVGGGLAGIVGLRWLRARL